MSDLRPAITTAINEALSRMPLKRLPVEKVRAQMIQHLSVSKAEVIARPGPNR